MKNPNPMKKLDREFDIFERGRGNTLSEMEKEENDDDGAHDGETAGEADAPAAASTTAPALPIAAAAAPRNVTGKRMLDARASPFVPSPATKRTRVPTDKAAAHTADKKETCGAGAHAAQVRSTELMTENREKSYTTIRAALRKHVQLHPSVSAEGGSCSN